MEPGDTGALHWWQNDAGTLSTQNNPIMDNFVNDSFLINIKHFK